MQCNVHVLWGIYLRLVEPLFFVFLSNGQTIIDLREHMSNVSLKNIVGLMSVKLHQNKNQPILIDPCIMGFYLKCNRVRFLSFYFLSILSFSGLTMVTRLILSKNSNTLETACWPVILIPQIIKAAWNNDLPILKYLWKENYPGPLEKK